MSAPLQPAASDIRSFTSHHKTMSTTEVDAVHPLAKSLLSQGRRPALSDLVNNGCSAGAPSEKTSSVDQKPSPTGCSSDGTKLRPVEVHSATARTCLNVPSPEPVAPSPEDIAQSPEEKAGNLSMEVMHTKLDCSDELYVLSDESSLAVADDAPEDSLLSSLTAPGTDHLVQGVPDHLELEPVKDCCETPEFLEPVPDVPVPELELSADESSDPDEESGIETMHLCDDEEGLDELPDEFKLDDKLFEVFRNVCGVRLHQKRSVPVIPSTPPPFAASPTLDLGYFEDDFVDLNTIEKPIQDELQYVPLD
ncbi:uncharacterized protein LOC119458285 [Dermacentor silvarum]|uniref:uncharacterized protein LOC119458285 n=1 Tax=Dermacentor silvarum TaxID=543639 RepID=UPI00189B3903|nr:uncharacterized protein LOC119458285 [Dermacentor silvarum]